MPNIWMSYTNYCMHKASSPAYKFAFKLLALLYRYSFLVTFSKTFSTYIDLLSYVDMHCDVGYNMQSLKIWKRKEVKVSKHKIRHCSKESTEYVGLVFHTFYKSMTADFEIDNFNHTVICMHYFHISFHLW